LKVGFVVTNSPKSSANDYKLHVVVIGMVTFWLISTSEVKNRNHHFGMNQKCHNGLWILHIEAQFWRKIIVFQERRNLNEEC